MFCWKSSQRSDRERPRRDPSLKHSGFEEVAKKAFLQLSQPQTTPSAVLRSLRGVRGGGRSPRGLQGEASVCRTCRRRGCSSSRGRWCFQLRSATCPAPAGRAALPAHRGCLHGNAHSAVPNPSLSSPRVGGEKPT